MPNANVVGVEVGSAVRIAPLKKGAPGVVYLLSEPVIRASYPPGVTNGPTCDTMINVPP